MKLKIQNTTIKLSYPDPLRAQGHEDMRLIRDNPRSRKNMDSNPPGSREAGHRVDRRFGKCLSCGKFH